MTKQANRPTGTATVSYFSIETMACQPKAGRVSCAVFPTWRGSSVIRAAAFACTIGEPVLKAPRNRSSCCPPLTFLKRQIGALAPDSASTPLESVKVKTVPGAGQTTSAFCARALSGLAAAASAQASTAASLERILLAGRRVTIELTSPRSSRPGRRRRLREAASHPRPCTRSAVPWGRPQEQRFAGVEEDAAAPKAARTAERSAHTSE